MITQDTTLVLGAGASAPYGFPSGAALVDQVVKTFSSGNDQKMGMLQNLGHDRQEIEAFAKALQRSGKSSVDAFLEHREDMADIGKASIAACLIPYEKDASLYRPIENWYSWLFTALNAPPDRFEENRLRIVTFNYDRSLEQYLFTCLTNSYNLQIDEAAGLVKSIPIVHLHGQLGHLPWQQESDDPVCYTGHVSPQTIRTARDSIRVIHEGRYDDPPMQMAQNFINNSQSLAFLGFGYNSNNMDRLRINSNHPFEYIGGSCRGMTRLEQQKAGRGLPQRFDWGHNAWDNLQFLRERVDLV